MLLLLLLSDAVLLMVTGAWYFSPRILASYRALLSTRSCSSRAAPRKAYASRSQVRRNEASELGAWLPYAVAFLGGRRLLVVVELVILREHVLVCMSDELG